MRKNFVVTKKNLRKPFTKQKFVNRVFFLQISINKTYAFLIWSSYIKGFNFNH